MKSLILCLLYISTSSLYSQDYLNHSAKWTEIHAYGGAGNPYITSEVYTIYLTGDTMINSMLYYTVLKSGTKTTRNWVENTIVEVVPISISLAPLREDGGVFYTYQAALDKDEVLHNFNLSVGDTAIYTCHLPQVVVKIDTIYIGNMARKQFHFVNFSGGGTSTLIEGVGCSHGLYEHPCNPYIVIEEGSRLQCYSFDDQYCQLDDDVDCGNATLVDWEKDDSSRILLFPNPCQNYVDIQFINYPIGRTEIQIINAEGRLFARTEILQPIGINRINLDDLPSGLYFVHLLIGNINEFRKIWISK